MALRRRWLFGLTGTLLLAVLLSGSYWLDRMALGYLTGQRRVPGRDFFGGEIRPDGPPPGFAFLGRTAASQDPPGLRMIEPWESGREIGLRRGDVVTSVAGNVYRDGRDLMRDLIRHYRAGDSVPLTVARRGDAPRELNLTLKPWIRTPADLGLPFEAVEIPSGSGFTLRGWFIPPPPGGDGRAGVFVHGAKSSRFQALEGAREWVRRGYGLLTMDLSGRGTSGGEYVTYSVNERRDVAAITAWLRARKGFSARGVVVFGTSNGAAAAIYAAAEDPDLPALALDAPFSDLWAAAGEMLQERGMSSWLLYPLSWAVRWRAGFRLRQVRPIDVINRVRAPVLFVHGDSDTQVRPYHSELLDQARRQAGLPTERWLIAGGEHGFDNYPPAEVFWGRVMDFFDKALGAQIGGERIQ